MADSYGGDPSANAKDYVRFRLGDRASPFLLTDAEISAILSETGGYKLLAAAKCAEAIAAQFAGQVNSQIGKTRTDKSDKFEHYTQLAEKLHEEHLQELTGTGAPISMPEIGTVSDVANFPAQLQPGEIGMMDWSGDEEVL